MFPVESSMVTESTDLFGFMPAVLQTLCMCPFHAYVVLVCVMKMCASVNVYVFVIKVYRQTITVLHDG